MVCALGLLAAACAGQGENSVAVDSEAEDENGVETDEADAEESAPEVDFSGETIRLLVGVGAGGGYDTWARQVAQYMEGYLPGEPSIQVENITGAGGGVMLTQLYSADADGTVFALTNSMSLALYEVVGGLEVDDPTAYTMIGQVSDEKKHAFVGSDSDYPDLESVENADGEVLAAVVGMAGGGGITTIGFFEEIGTDWRPVTHEGSADALLSVIRGDTDLMFVSFDSVAGEVEDGDLVPIMYTGHRPEDEGLVIPEEYADLPSAGDRGWDDFVLISSEARTFIAPPGMEPAVQEALENALREATADPGFQEWLDSAGNTLQYLSAQETEAALVDGVEAMRRYESALGEWIG